MQILCLYISQFFKTLLASSHDMRFCSSKFHFSFSYILLLYTFSQSKRQMTPHNFNSIQELISAKFNKTKKKRDILRENYSALLHWFWCLFYDFFKKLFCQVFMNYYGLLAWVVSLGHVPIGGYLWRVLLYLSCSDTWHYLECWADISYFQNPWTWKPTYFSSFF